MKSRLTKVLRGADGDRSEKRARLPAWIREETRRSRGGGAVRALLRSQGLHSVCEEARCPNRGRCFSKARATFLILGPVCTRGCGFCAVSRGRAPAPADPLEPRRVARTASELGLRHVVVTSVTRDDLPDGGAGQFAATIRALREALPAATVEVLVPDFQGRAEDLDRVLAERPDVLNHNIETVPRLYPSVRPGADYGRSLSLLRRAAESGGVRVKSGLMVGLGETREEVETVMDDLLAAGCRYLTIGQYLRPGSAALPVVEYVAPESFLDYGERARRKGFDRVSSGPLVRSSMDAEEMIHA